MATLVGVDIEPFVTGASSRVAYLMGLNMPKSVHQGGLTRAGVYDRSMIM